MNRREAISRVSLILGGTILGAEAFLAGCKDPGHPIGGAGVDFSNDDLAFLDEVAETILPATDSPGAREAKVGAFMALIVRDCYTEKDQKIFVDGLRQLDEASKKKNGHAFLAGSQQEKHALLVELDKEQKDYTRTRKDDQPAHYFRMIMELTLWGYFTSEAGGTKALRYVAVPGRYEGCTDYKKGEKAWATN